MREIRFRMWEPLINRMSAVSALSNTGSYDRIWEAQPDGERYLTPNCVLMQDTGLRDRNGKEIYEGDIIVAKDYPFYGDNACETELNYVGEVFWDDEGLRWYYELHRVSNRVRGAACGDALHNQKHEDKTSSDWEVIGNIYQHPHMLEPT